MYIVDMFRIIFICWVFGGIDRTTKKCFLELVKDRKAGTLLPIIRKWIKPGSNIISDGWQGYNDIAHIEHAKAKKHFRRNCSTSQELFPSHVAEVMWRMNLRGKSPFIAIIQFVKCKYPL
jgi:transposase-like protein